MAREIEIKLAIKDTKRLLRGLKRLGAKARDAKCPRVHEMNLIFDTPDGGLAKHGQLLRIRRETPANGKKKAKGEGCDEDAADVQIAAGGTGDGEGVAERGPSAQGAGGD